MKRFTATRAAGLFLLAAFMISATLHPNFTLTDTGTLKGQVTDADNGDPLPFVQVKLANSSYSNLTDFDGNYVFNHLPPGDYEAEFSLVGYTTYKETFKIEQGRTTGCAHVRGAPHTRVCRHELSPARRPD